MLVSLNRQRGFSLIELMISTTIGLILLGVLGNIYVSSVKSNTINLRISMLNQELQSLLHMVNSDVRRAGYWAAVPGTADVLAADPFMSDMNDLTISEKTGETTNSCITYSYDLDKDKKVDVGATTIVAPFNDTVIYDVDNMEQFGFRKNGTSVEMRTGLATTSDTTFDCDSGAWTRITDSNDEITNMNFELKTQYLDVTGGIACSDPGPGNTGTTINCCVTGQACQLIRNVIITITGGLASDQNVVKTVTARTRIRNDRYIALAP